MLPEAANAHPKNQGAFGCIVCRQLPAKLSMFGQSKPSAIYFSSGQCCLAHLPSLFTACAMASSVYKTFSMSLCKAPMLLVCKAAKYVGWRFKGRRLRRVSGTPTMNRRADALQTRAVGAFGAKVCWLYVRIMRGSGSKTLKQCQTVSSETPAFELVRVVSCK